MCIESNVRFLGFREDVSDILPVLDLFVLPSISEGLPNVILEAMACSVPVLASLVGGIPEAVKHNYSGILVSAGDSNTIRDAMLDLLQHKQKRLKMGKNGRHVVEDKFSLQKQIREFHLLYEALYNSYLNIQGV